MLAFLSSIPGYHLYILIISIVIFAGLHILFSRPASNRQRAEILLMYSIGITGFNGFTSFVAHSFFADAVANSIGWETGSLFQLEVAGANLAMGVIGYLGFWRRDFWLPYILAKFAFSWTAGAAHVIDILRNANFAVGNAGPILYWDFLLPVVLLALYLYQRPGNQAEQSGYIRKRPLAQTAPQGINSSLGIRSQA